MSVEPNDQDLSLVEILLNAFELKRCTQVMGPLWLAWLSSIESAPRKGCVATQEAKRTTVVSYMEVVLNVLG